MLPSRAPRAARVSPPLTAALVALAALVFAAAGELARADRVPEKHVTLDKGRLWKAPWRLIAYRTKDGHVCEGIVRRDNRFNICSNVPQVADPILVPFSQTKAGPRPTTYMLIAVSDEIATVIVRLTPGGRTLTLPVGELSAREADRSGLPPGFRYVVVAVPKKRGFSSILGLGPDGRLVGRRVGTGAPP